MPYSVARKDLLFYLKELGYISKDYGWHSFRHGGDTAAADAGVPDRLFKSHGRWQSDKAKDGYVHEHLKTKLSVTAALNL